MPGNGQGQGLIFLSPGERWAGPPAIAGALSDPLMPFSAAAQTSMGIRDTKVMAPIPRRSGGSREMKAAGDVLVATGTDGRIAAVVALATGMRRAALDFERRHIRGGVSRSPPAHAVAEARRRVGRAAGRPKIRTP